MRLSCSPSACSLGLLALDQVNPHVPFLLPLLCPLPMFISTHWEKLHPGLCDLQLLHPANAFGGKGILYLCTPSALLLAALAAPNLFPHTRFGTGLGATVLSSWGREHSTASTAPELHFLLFQC